MHDSQPLAATVRAGRPVELTTLSRRARAVQGVLWAYKPKLRIFSTVAVAAANLKQWDVMYAYLSRMNKAPSTSHFPPPSRASCAGRPTCAQLTRSDGCVAEAATYHALMDAAKRAQNWQATMDLAAHNHAKVRRGDTANSSYGSVVAVVLHGADGRGGGMHGRVGASHGAWRMRRSTRHGSWGVWRLHTKCTG